MASSFDDFLNRSAATNIALNSQYRIPMVKGRFAGLTISPILDGETS